MTNLRHKIHKWRDLPWRERLLLAHLCLLLTTAWLGLRLLSFNTMLRLAESALPAGKTPPTAAFARRCARLTATAARHCLPEGSCLPEALVLCRVLRTRGLAARVRIGVTSPAKGLEAHAWVELEGEPLGQEVGRFAPLHRLQAEKT